MKKIYAAICYVLVFVLLATPVSAATEDVATELFVADSVIITEIQTGSAAGGDEFVELYNASDAEVDITGWQLRYVNATSTEGSTTLIATIALPDDAPVLLQPGGYFVLHTASVSLAEGIAGQTYPAKLSSTDKTVALFAPQELICELVVYDAVGWGTSTSGEGAAAQLATGVTGERILRRYQNAEGLYVDGNNNATDFMMTIVEKGLAVPQVAKVGTPGMDNAVTTGDESSEGNASVLTPIAMDDCTVPEDEEPDTTEPPILPPTSEPPATVEPEEPEPVPAGPVFPVRNSGLVAPHVSELLPNPAKPQTDAADEFVELYNSNDLPFELSGFMLEVGKKRYIFPQGTMLAARTFNAFYSADTRLALSNTQGQARLLDPAGRIIAQSDAYQSAKDGYAWGLAQGKWQWTVTPTPNGANAIKAPESKKSTAKKASTGTGTTKAAGTPDRTVSEQKDVAATLATDQPATPLHPGVLALVGAFAILYGAYEYRRDVANKFYQLRDYRAARRANRQQFKGQ